MYGIYSGTYDPLSVNMEHTPYEGGESNAINDYIKENGLNSEAKERINHAANTIRS